MDRAEDLIEKPDDHGHQHRNGKADDDLLNDRQVAHVRFNELKHADVRGNPGQRAKPEHQEQFFPVSGGLFRLDPIAAAEFRRAVAAECQTRLAHRRIVIQSHRLDHPFSSRGRRICVVLGGTASS